MVLVTHMSDLLSHACVELFHFLVAHVDVAGVSPQTLLQVVDPRVQSPEVVQHAVAPLVLVVLEELILALQLSQHFVF